MRDGSTLELSLTTTDRCSPRLHPPLVLRSLERRVIRRPVLPHGNTDDFGSSAMAGLSLGNMPV